MSSNDEIERRIKALMKRMNASEHGRSDACMCVLQTGGLPPGELMFAKAGEHSWMRGVSDQGEIVEEEESFVARVKEEARAAGERMIHVSSFPKAGDDEQHRIARLVESYFWEFGDDGVPPCEPHHTRSRH
jgi:hypothetical protein